MVTVCQLEFYYLRIYYREQVRRIFYTIVCTTSSTASSMAIYKLEPIHEQ